MKKSISLFLVLGFCCLLMGISQSAVINVPGDQATLTGAITAASANDTISINAVGPYDEVVTVNKPLTILGNGVRPNICARLNAASPAGANDGFTVTGFSGTCYLKNLNIIPSRTSTPTDDGIMIYAGAGSVMNVVMDGIVECPNNGSDQPVTLTGLSDPDLTGATVFGDDGMSITGLDSTSVNTTTITNSVFCANRNGVPGTGNDGMVIFPGPGSGSKLYIGSGTVISYNNRMGIQWGGGGADIDVVGTPSKPVLILGNKGTSSLQGGLGMFNGQGKVANCIIANNGTSGISEIAGATLLLGFTSISSTIITGNTGDGMHFDDNALSHSQPMNISNVTFANNTQSPIEITVGNANTTINMINCIIAGNGSTTDANNVILSNSLNTTIIQNSAIVTAGPYSLNTTIANFNGTNGTGPFSSTAIVNAAPTFLSVNYSDYAISVSPPALNQKPTTSAVLTGTGGKYVVVTNAAYATAASGGNPLAGGGGYAPGGTYLGWNSSDTTIATNVSSAADTAVFSCGTTLGTSTVTVTSVNGASQTATITISGTSAPLVRDPQISSAVITSKEIKMP